MDHGFCIIPIKCARKCIARTAQYRNLNRPWSCWLVRSQRCLDIQRERKGSWLKSSCRRNDQENTTIMRYNIWFPITLRSIDLAIHKRGRSLAPRPQAPCTGTRIRRNLDLRTQRACSAFFPDIELHALRTHNRFGASISRLKGLSIL